MTFEMQSGLMKNTKCEHLCTIKPHRAFEVRRMKLLSSNVMVFLVQMSVIQYIASPLQQKTLTGETDRDLPAKCFTLSV